MSFESARELLMHFCKKYELDHARTHLLLSELESIQKNQASRLTPEEFRELVISRREKRQNKFKNENKSLVLSLVVRMIDSDATLGKLLTLNKQINHDLKDDVYKQALLMSQPKRLPVKRVAIWSAIFQIKEN